MCVCVCDGVWVGVPAWVTVCARVCMRARVCSFTSTHRNRLEDAIPHIPQHGAPNHGSVCRGVFLRLQVRVRQQLCIPIRVASVTVKSSQRLYEDAACRCVPFSCGLKDQGLRAWKIEAMTSSRWSMGSCQDKISRVAVSVCGGGGGGGGGMWWGRAELSLAHASLWHFHRANVLPTWLAF